jgi:hypothetical protein
MLKAASPWTVPVAVEDIPDSGLHLEIEAPAETRAAVAEVAGLRELPSLSAVFDLDRQGAVVQVHGQVNARVGQTCVVTLEPLESTLEEPIDVRFAPAVGEDTAVRVGGKHKGGKDEPPEPLIDGKLDLGALATEFLMLGIDPYPRKAGAKFAPPKVEEVAEHPFAALAALKKRGSGGEP